MDGQDASVVRRPTAVSERCFIGLVALYATILIPIVRADRYCNDDLKRALFGRTGWDSNGRPLTTFVMKLLQSYDHALVDISPLTQIGAVLVLSWSGALLAAHYRIRPWWLGALLTFPLGAQPFFLENMSYKFDSFPMSLAVLLSVVPWRVDLSTRRGRWLGVLSLFAGLCFYQPAFNVFLVLICADFVVGQIERDDFFASLRVALFRTLQAVIAFGLYEIIVGIHVNGWVKERAQPIASIDDLHFMADTAMHFAQFVGASFGIHWWLYFAPLLIAFAVVCWCASLGMAWRTRDGLALTSLKVCVNLAVPFVALAAVLGPMLLLIDPPIVPRVLVGAGALLAGGLLVSMSAFRAMGWSANLPASAATMLAVGTASIASAYGNAAAEQRRYEEHIAASIADDFAELRAHRGVRRYLIDGTSGWSAISEHVIAQFPLVGELIPPFINGEDRFHTHVFLQFFMPTAADYRESAQPGWASRVAETIRRSGSEKILVTRQAYDIRVVGDIAVIRFSRPSSAVASHLARNELD